MLDIMLLITRALRCCWCASAYSIASRPPQDWPNRTKSSRVSPSAVRTCSTSSTNRSIVHSDGSSGRSLEPEQVLVRGAGAAVQEQQLRPRVVAGPLGPHPVAPCGRGDRHHPHAAAQHVGAAGVVEVAHGARL